MESAANPLPKSSKTKKTVMFSHSCLWEIKWSKIDPRFSARLSNFECENEQVNNLLKILYQIKFVTIGQLLRTFWPQKNKIDVKKKLKKLVQLKVLTVHMLNSKVKNTSLVFFTLGPVGNRIIGQPYYPNWWFDFTDTEYVLKQLITNQLFLRLYRNLTQTKFYPTPYPFQGVLGIGETELPIIVVREASTEIIREIKYINYEKSIIICEDQESLEKIMPVLSRRICRFTTDYELCNTPLRYAFFKWDEKENEKIKRVVIKMFPDNG